MFNSERKLKSFRKYLLNASCMQGIVLNNAIVCLTSDINSLINPFTKDLIIKKKVHLPIMEMS